MNTQAYIDISEQIRTNVPAIEEIDIYNRQYEDPAYHENYNYPAVYIEFLPNEWANNNDGTQQGLGGFIIHVVVGLVDENTRNIDQQNSGNQANYLAPFNIFQAVHDALNWTTTNQFMPTGCITGLERVADTPDHNYSMVLIMKMKYTCIMLDDGTGAYNAGNWEQTPLTDVIAQPDIEG